MKPTSNNGSIIIRFTKFGYKYSLTNLGKFCEKQAYAEAMRICLAIENDIKLGRFTCKTNDELFTAYHPMAKLSSHHELNTYAVDAITLVESHLKTLKYRDKVLSPVLSLLKAYGKAIKTRDEATKFFTWMSNDGKRSNNSNNRYLEALAPVCPMFVGVPRVKASKVKKDEKPFSKDEIKSIIKSFDEHFPHYTPFIKFLFSTGCRPSEAIALVWDCVDFEAETITIKDSIGTASDGSKVRKETKTGVTRVIPMSPTAYRMLRNKAGGIRCMDDPDLVFRSPADCYIDIGNFRERVWVKALEQAKVPYRTLYNCRHTFCSHFLNEKPDFVQLASITHGTKSGIATLQKHYAHLVSSVVMPDMFD